MKVKLHVRPFRDEKDEAKRQGVLNITLDGNIELVKEALELIEKHFSKENYWETV